MQTLPRAPASPLALLARLAGRALSAVGAVLLLGGLELAWYATDDGRVLDAFEYHGLVDVALAGLAVAALAAGALRRRALSGAVRVAAGLAALAIVVGLHVALDPAQGGRVALYGAIAIAAGGLLDAVPDAPRRLAAGVRALLPRLGRSAVLAVPLAIVTWPVYTLAPGGGTDGSGPGGLHEATWRGIDFGADFVFTYGPLGFLTFARYYHLPTSILSVLYVALVHWALIAAVLALARRALGLLPALVVAFAAGAAFANTTPDDPTSTAITALALLATIALFRDPPEGRRLDGALLATGALAGFATLVKPNTGVTIVALAGILAVFLPAPSRVRALALCVGAGVVNFLVLWLAAGEEPGAILPYFRHASEILSGYGEAGASEEAGRAWEYPAAAVIAALALGGAAWATRRWPRRARAGALLALAVFTFGWFKGGFVHHDGHVLHFFAAMIAAGLAFLTAGNRIPALAAGAAALAAFTVSGLGTDLFAVGDLVRPRISQRDFRDHVQTLLPERAGAYEDEQRALLRTTYGFDAATLAAVRGRTVHFEPQEASAAWAYPEIDWRPLPVFQSPFAFTTRLDEVNAAFLRSADAPERILRSDEGAAPLESPRAFLELFCRYDEVVTSPEAPGSPYRWQTLARGPSRCGPPRRIATRAARTGADMPVPRGAADELVFVRIHGLELSFAEKLRKTLDKVREQRFLAFDEQPPRLLVAEKATSPLVLAIPERHDWSVPFTASVDARRLRAEVIGMDGERAAPRPIRVDFYAVGLSRPAR